MAAPYTVRPVRAHEWREIRTLRLAALSDPAAPIAFLESFDEAAGRPDEFWQDRARRSSLDAGQDAGVRHFVALADDGTWVGSATVLIESAGDVDFAGRVVELSGGHVVGVFVASANRGQGVLTSLLGAATDWMRERGRSRARLHVHVDNGRARRAYEKAGFVATGVQITAVNGPELEMAKAISAGA
jgi:RimJ/RimL family protein N-acetyltransferase